MKLIQYIKDLLLDVSADPSMIEFEITESAYLNNFTEAEDFFRELRGLGFSIALDDFGTGYSSLGYLTRITIDTLKIDQTFVRELEESSKDKLIIEAIIRLAHSLGLNICAEGVETAEQRDFLIDAGCQQLQGHFYAKPSIIDDLPDVLSNMNQQQRSVLMLHS